MANAVIPSLAPLQLEVFDKEDNIVKVYLVVKGITQTNTPTHWCVGSQ